MNERGEPGPAGQLRFSVVIPYHRLDWYRRAVQSALAQTLPAFEILLAPNGPAKKEVLDVFPARVRRVESQATGSIGAVKHEAFSAAEGDWIVELDHDDELLPNCLERLNAAAIANPDATMLYSNPVAAGWGQTRYMEGCGWQYRTHPRGVEIVHPEACPQHLARIWTAPDHVRAYRRDWYQAQGGHDVGLPVADDHDLSCRAYLTGRIVHLDEPLYVYTIHDEQNTKTRNAEIQRLMWQNFFRYLEPLMMKWSQDRHLSAFDLGARINPRAGYTSVDRFGADVCADLEEPWPFPDSSCGLIRASNVLEHLRDPLHTMNELWRCLAHGGVAIIRVPSTDGRGAWCDPTHTSYWNIASFRYYTQQRYARFIQPQSKARFQVLRLQDTVEDGIVYTDAHLIAVKDGPRFHGLLEI